MKVNEITVSLTYEDLDIIMDCLSVTKKHYPLSWNKQKQDERTFEKIQKAYFLAYEIERSKNGEEESRQEE